MTSILRSIAAVIVGFVVASAVMMVFETVNGKVLYPGLGKSAEGVTDREVVRQIMAAAPVGALLVVIAGWAVGSLCGGFVAGKIAKAGAVRAGIVLGILLTAAGVANNLALPPPLWFWPASLIVMLPCAWFGARAAGGR